MISEPVSDEKSEEKMVEPEKAVKIERSTTFRPWLWGNVFLIIVLFLLVGVGIGFYYSKVQQMTQTISQLQTQISTVSEASGIENATLTGLQQTVNDQGLQLLEQHKVLERLSLFTQQRQTDVFLQVASANQKIDALPLLGSLVAHKDALPKPTAPQINTWKERLMQSLKQLKFLIVVRKTPNPLLPLIAQEEGDYINQYIHLQLGQAQWAVLRNNNKVYQSCLAQAHFWVSRYFIAQDPKTQSVLHDLEALQKIDVSFPAITNGDVS